MGETLCLWALIPMSNVAMPPSTGSSGIWDWTPDAATVLADLTNSVAIDDPRVLMKSFQGIDIGAEAYPWFEGFGWVRFTSEHWEVPLTAVSAYFILIPTLRWAVAKYGKWNVRDFAFYWNLSLSLFSWYGYFAITATKYRKCVTPFAIFISLAQLLQMLVGMYVTVKAVFHQARGEECHVIKTNSVLGLGMYFSYFVLFFKLFMDNYCMNDNKKLSALPRKPSVSLEVVRKASVKALDDMSAHVHDCHIEKKTA